MKRHALGWFAAAALVTAIGTADPAHASRRVIDVTDAETRAYCKANPTHCKKSIAWGPTLGMWIGIPVAFGFIRSIFD